VIADTTPAGYSGAQAAGGGPAGAEDIRALLASILPRPEEAQWEEIPWQTDIWDARRVASQVGKPIFAWMMNGSVLGCT
jgi:hypothetical protein